MDRVPEPELMDEPEQALAYASADFASPHNRFVSLFAEVFPSADLAGTHIIDLGCGPADVTIRFAKAYPGCWLTGVDAGPNMLALARKSIDATGLSRRIRLVHCHLPAPTLEASTYDAVISNSLLHHLADPLVLWRSIAHCAKPDAPILVMDLMRPADVVSLNGLVEEYVRNEPEILQQDFRNSLLASYRADKVKQQLMEVGLPNMAVQVVSDRHWIAYGSR